MLYNTEDYNYYSAKLKAYTNVADSIIQLILVKLLQVMFTIMSNCYDTIA